MSFLPGPPARPEVILFDWHATLADTHDAMYLAIDDILRKLGELNLMERLVKTEESKTVEDAKLVRFVRENARLHPKIKQARKISRTDLFEILFGVNEEAKRVAHTAFDASYRNHFGEVYPTEEDIRPMLSELRTMNLLVGVLSNRSREFLDHEIRVIDGTGWAHLFDTVVCGDDVQNRKPAPDLIFKALKNIDKNLSVHCWYIGDSTTDVIAAKKAGVTGVFYNGAGWSQDWINRIFPETARHPHKPDVVINSFRGLSQLVRTCMELAPP